MSSVSLNVSGQALNTAQRLAVQTALTKLKVDENLSSVRLWGKINGSQKDYIVAQATTVKETIQKQYYFSDNGGITFAKLPPVEDWIREKAVKVRGLFNGNSGRKYKDGRIYTEEEEEEEKAQEEEEAAEDDEDDEEKRKAREEKKLDPQYRKLTELERLAYTVEEIENACGIVPRGTWYLTATGAILPNHSFAGLSPDDAKKLSSYQLFRAPQDPHTLARIRKNPVSNNPDFLDTLDNKGEWSLQVDDTGLNVTLRSLVWLGYEFRLEANSNSFVGGYFGYGEKNLDLPFML